MLSRVTAGAALVALIAASPVSAQFRNDGYRGLSSVGSQTAYDRGYREGADEGRKDARDRSYFEFERDGDYRNADKGYKREFGEKESYKRVFRQGYATGYTDGYNGRNVAQGGMYPTYPESRPRAIPRGSRYPGYPSNPNYPSYPGSPSYPGNGGNGSIWYQEARDNGYYDGIEKAQEDLRKNRSFDLDRHAWYRSADRGYDDDRGLSKDSYRNAYRQGFRTGYEQGYRRTNW